MNAENTAVIVVDMQNDFCHPDGALYAPSSEEAIGGVNGVIEIAHDNGAFIFLTQDTHTVGHPEFEKWGEHCLGGTWGHDIHRDIDLDPDCYPVVQKDTYDAFYATDLDQMLRARQIGSLVLCGTLVNVCVQETASSANLYGYDVAVVEDAVGYLDEDQKAAALDHIDFLIGDVVEIDDL